MSDRLISEERISRALRLQADEALRPFDPTEIARLAAGSGSKLSRRWDSLLGRPSRPVWWVIAATALLLLAAIAGLVGASLLRNPAPMGGAPLFVVQWVCDLDCANRPTGIHASTIDPLTGESTASWDLPFVSDTMSSPSVQPAWSPDRRHVLLYDWNNHLVAIVDVATGTLATPAGDVPTGITGYTWGPRSDQIARVTGDDALGVSIYDLTLHQLARFEVPVHAMIDSPPAWSPDGSTLVVTGCFPCDTSAKGSSPAPHQPQLFLMPVDGSPVRAIPITSPSYVRGGLAWSPDGRTLALGSEAGIWTIGVADGQPRLVASGPGYDPRWSPDGTRIAFGSTRDGVFGGIDVGGIVVVDLETGRRTPLTNRPDTRPQWSPDGTWIGFSRPSPPRDGPSLDDIWIVPAIGGEPRLISTGATVGW